MTKQSVALVTGASSGMGAAIAAQLLSDGYCVYAAARRIALMADLERSGAIAIQLDITNEAEVAAAVAAIERQHGAVDVLINNAGFGSYGAMEDTSIADARYQFEVNLFGPACLTQAVLPYMRGQGGGKIVNISSMGGKIYTPLGAWYHASKHALEGWSDCLRLELAPFGIAVIIIEPGVIATEFGTRMLGPMLARSGGSAYADLANRMAAATAKSYAPGSGSPPTLVAHTVSRALKARRPKTRYVVGKMARPLLMVRKWGGDRLFDWVIGQSV
jgi:NAD(P)-dependent dehydrogenase (short-subunit alcohol dehydrogenase family)